jgi:hypothetical protein
MQPPSAGLPPSAPSLRASIGPQPEGLHRPPSLRSALLTAPAAAMTSSRADMTRVLTCQVGYWESQLLGKCLRRWHHLPVVLRDAGRACADLTREKTLRRHMQAMIDAYRDKRLDSVKYQQAALHFGGGLVAAAFRGWRGVLLQAKSWFMLGEQVSMHLATCHPTPLNADGCAARCVAPAASGRSCTA